MSTGDFTGRPVLAEAWARMPVAMQRTVTTAPVIPQIAARARAAAADHPDMVRGDQGQVVGVIPEREIYYGPSSGLPDLRRLVARFWTLAYGLAGRPGIPERGLGAEHVAIVSGATEGVAILMRLLAPGCSVGVQRFHWGNYRNLIAHAAGEPVVIDFFADDGRFDLQQRVDAAPDPIDLLVAQRARPTAGARDAELRRRRSRGRT